MRRRRNPGLASTAARAAVVEAVPLAVLAVAGYVAFRYVQGQLPSWLGGSGEGAPDVPAPPYVPMPGAPDRERMRYTPDQEAAFCAEHPYLCALGAKPSADWRPAAAVPPDQAT